MGHDKIARSLRVKLNIGHFWQKFERHGTPFFVPRGIGWGRGGGEALQSVLQAFSRRPTIPYLKSVLSDFFPLKNYSIVEFWLKFHSTYFF